MCTVALSYYIRLCPNRQALFLFLRVLTLGGGQHQQRSTAQHCSGSSAGVAGGGGFGRVLFGGGLCGGLRLFGGGFFRCSRLCGVHRIGGRRGVRRLYWVGGTFRVRRWLGISGAFRISGRLRLTGPRHGEGHRLQALVVAQGAGIKEKTGFFQLGGGVKGLDRQGDGGICLGGRHGAGGGVDHLR